MNSDQPYRCLDEQSFAFGAYTLVPLRQRDIFAIKEWRNAQIDVLRQEKPLTDQDQQRYYEQVIVPTYSEQQPDMLLFSFLLEGELIGYGGLVHINWPSRRAEVSFLVAPARREETQIYQNDFHAFFFLIKILAFQHVQLHRLTTETFAFRRRTLALLEQHGFVQEGRLRQHIRLREGFVDSLVHGCLKTAVLLPKISILVTSIGQKISLLQAVRHAAAKVAVSSTIHGGDHDHRCLARYHADVFWPMKSDAELTAQEILSYCLQHGIHVIIPTRDAELLLYANMNEMLQQHGINVMLSTHQGVSACVDKLMFYQTCRTKPALSVIPAVLDINQLVADRFVVKERYGAGSHNVGLDLSREDGLEHAATLSYPIFQPFIKGTEYSVDMYIDMQGRCKGVEARTRDQVQNGESQISTTVRQEDLEMICRAIAHHLQLKGHLVFQALRDAHDIFHIIECNCRFGGASTLAVAAGLDSFFWFFLESMGQDVSQHPFSRCLGELRQVKAASAHIFPA